MGIGRRVRGDGIGLEVRRGGGRTRLHPRLHPPGERAAFPLEEGTRVAQRCVKPLAAREWLGAGRMDAWAADTGASLSVFRVAPKVSAGSPLMD